MSCSHFVGTLKLTHVKSINNVRVSYVSGAKSYNCRGQVSEDASDDVSTDSTSTDAASIGDFDEEGTPVPSDTEDALDDCYQLKLSKK